MAVACSACVCDQDVRMDKKCLSARLTAHHWQVGETGTYIYAGVVGEREDFNQ